MKSRRLYILAFVLSLFGTFLALLTYIERKALPYTDLGSYFDQENLIVYYEHALIFYGCCFFVFVILTIYTGKLMLHKHPKSHKN